MTRYLPLRGTPGFSSIPPHHVWLHWQSCTSPLRKRYRAPHSSPYSLLPTKRQWKCGQASREKEALGKPWVHQPYPGHQEAILLLGIKQNFYQTPCFSRKSPWQDPQTSSSSRWQWTSHVPAMTGSSSNTWLLMRAFNFNICDSRHRLLYFILHIYTSISQSVCQRTPVLY